MLDFLILWPLNFTDGIFSFILHVSNVFSLILSYPFMIYAYNFVADCQTCIHLLTDRSKRGYFVFAFVLGVINCLSGVLSCDGNYFLRFHRCTLPYRRWLCALLMYPYLCNGCTLLINNSSVINELLIKMMKNKFSLRVSVKTIYLKKYF